MGITDQVLTLCGVLLGAATSYVVSFLGEKRRDRRDLANRWDDRRYDAYGKYANEVKNMLLLARRIAAFYGIQPTESPLDPAEGLSLLDEAETRRELATEFVTMVAGPDTINAYRKMNSALNRAEWAARGMIPNINASEWAAIEADANDALNSFYVSVRRELGVRVIIFPENTIQG